MNNQPMVVVYLEFGIFGDFPNLEPQSAEHTLCRFSCQHEQGFALYGDWNQRTSGIPPLIGYTINGPYPPYTQVTSDMANRYRYILAALQGISPSLDFTLESNGPELLAVFGWHHPNENKQSLTFQALLESYREHVSKLDPGKKIFKTRLSGKEYPLNQPTELPQFLPLADCQTIPPPQLVWMATYQGKPYIFTAYPISVFARVKNFWDSVQYWSEKYRQIMNELIP